MQVQSLVLGRHSGAETIEKCLGTSFMILSKLRTPEAYFKEHINLYSNINQMLTEFSPADR